MRALSIPCLLLIAAASSAEAKPQPPIRVRSSLEGAVRAGRQHEMMLRVEPLTDMQIVAVRVRGVDGVDVQASALRTQVSVLRGQSLEISAHVQVRDEAYGYVAVEVVARPLSEKTSRQFAFTKVFGIRAIGARPRLVTIGERSVDGAGRAIIRMEAKER